MQVASEHYSIVFDLFALCPKAEFQSFCAKLFKNKGIVKVGHSFLQSDLPSLRRTYRLRCFEKVANLFDLQLRHSEYTGGPQLSLKQLTAHYLSSSRK